MPTCAAFRLSSCLAPHARPRPARSTPPLWLTHSRPLREQVQQCVAGPEGSQLALEAATATEALDPPHEYAPWLTLNGQPLRDRAYDLQAPPPPPLPHTHPLN